MKKKVFLVVASLMIVFSSLFAYAKDSKNNSIPNEVLQVANDNFDKVVSKISADLAIEYATEIDKGDFTLGEGYNISYIRKDININENYKKLENMIESSNDWIFVIKYKNKSVSYMSVGYLDNSYKLLMYGGNADMFDTTFNNFSKLNSKSITLLSYMGSYYMLNENDKIFEIPSNETSYKQNKDKYDVPMSGVSCSEIIKKTKKIDNERKDKGEAVQYGSGSLIEHYYESIE